MTTENQTINLNDLKLMAHIIKVVSTRGAIQADEMTIVGTLYNKLDAFIKAAEPAAPASDQEALQPTEQEANNG